MDLTHSLDARVTAVKARTRSGTKPQAGDARQRQTATKKE